MTKSTVKHGFYGAFSIFLNHLDVFKLLLHPLLHSFQKAVLGAVKIYAQKCLQTLAE